MSAIVRVFLALLFLVCGCARSKHLQRADQATYSVLRQKTGNAPWRPPAGYDVMPDSRARFYDPTCVVDPRLPMPAPVLYGYAMPELVTRAARIPGSAPTSYEGHPGKDGESGGSSMGGVANAGVRPLEASAWDSLPDSCLRRMLEFDSVRREYQATYVDAELTGSHPVDDGRLHLPAIVELALINSRAYQTQKEALYQVALRLTLERYAYELQFLLRGNGTDVNFAHTRNQGNTVNTLGIPTGIGVQKVSRRGADVLARFANDVVLTFNGPSGFSSQIGSELLFQMSQSLFQRDVIFESLTQAERDVIYAAREFARFRKEFFVGFARDYYSLLLAYRSIEINSFDFFSNQREFRKGEATFLAGKVSRIQVDQFEQNALRSRSNLVRSCNSLENALDNLKIRIGIPPEMPLNIDLSELDALTRSDSLAATFQQASRNRRSMERVLQPGEEGLAVQLNLAKLYCENLMQVHKLRNENQAKEEGKSAVRSPEEGRLVSLLHQLKTLEALLKTGFNDDILQADLRMQPPVAPLRLFQRRVEVARALLEAKRLLETAPAGDPDESLPDPMVDPPKPLDVFDSAEQEIEQLIEDLQLAIREQNVDDIDSAVAASKDLLQYVRVISGLTPADYEVKDLRTALGPLVADLFQAGDALESSRVTLPGVDIALDDAMLTAATQRFELATARERLADTWRQIKLRGDDLRAIASWSFRQSIRTPSNQNQPFSFTFDESDTRLSFSFDAPLNRFRERNAFRVALINYNRQLRSLLQTEDEIKLSVRVDLRNLELDRNQYEIAVASAALAAERVYSTRLRFDQGNGTARDFLEAQQAYTESLSEVASQHIGFLVDRMQLFLDLEQLQVDELGYWQDLYNDDAPVLVRTEMPQYGASIYGDLPCVKLSNCIKRMLCVPAGEPRIELPVDDAEELEEVEEAEAGAGANSNTKPGPKSRAESAY